MGYSMNRRLYFLLPDANHARETVAELGQMGIGNSAIHALSRDGEPLARLPAAASAQREDRTAWVERLLWNGNLTLFFIALLGLLVAAYSGSYGWMAGCAGVMGIAFIAGERFTALLPNTHIESFRDALNHGQVLLMVDIPFYRLREVETRIHRHHPEAESGGSCWHLSAVG